MRLSPTFAHIALPPAIYRAVSVDPMRPPTRFICVQMASLARFTLCVAACRARFICAGRSAFTAISDASSPRCSPPMPSATAQRNAPGEPR